VRRARALGHGRALVDVYPALIAMAVISRPSELTDQLIRVTLKLAPGTPLVPTLPRAAPRSPTPPPPPPPKPQEEEEEEVAEELAPSLQHDNSRRSVPTCASDWGSSDDMYSMPNTPSMRTFSATIPPMTTPSVDPSSKPLISPPDGWVMMSAEPEKTDGVVIKPERWSKWTAVTNGTNATDSSAVLNLNLSSLAAGYLSHRTSIATARAFRHAPMPSALDLDELDDGEEEGSVAEQAQLDAVLAAPIDVDPEEAQRLERERDEFVKWQQEQAASMTAIERERTRRKEAARVRSEEQRRDKLMQKLSKEQRKWCGSMPMAAASRIERQHKPFTRHKPTLSQDTASSDTRASKYDTIDSRTSARMETTDSRTTTSTAATSNSVHGRPSVDTTASRSNSGKLSRMSEESVDEQQLRSDKSTKKSATLHSTDARFAPTLASTLAAPPSSKASSISTIRRPPSSSPPDAPLPRNPSVDDLRSSTEQASKGNSLSPVPSSCLEPAHFSIVHPRSSHSASNSRSTGGSTAAPLSPPRIAPSSPLRAVPLSPPRATPRSSPRAAATTTPRTRNLMLDGRPSAKDEAIEAARAAAAATLVDARFRQPEIDLGPTPALGLWMPAAPPQTSKWSMTTIDQKTQAHHSGISSVPPVPAIPAMLRPAAKAERLFLEGESWLERQMRSRIAADREAQYAAKERPRSKQLPPPPPLSEEELEDARWAGESHDDMTRVAEARRRAHAADRAARAQIEVARLEQRRLAFEVSEAERRNRERAQAEFLARAKWAREQALRDQLGAYERSQLESEVGDAVRGLFLERLSAMTDALFDAQERRRRAAVERMKEEEEARAAAARREQEQRELDERDAVQAAERQARSRALREAKLREEAEAARRRQEEAQRRAQAKTRAREALEGDFRALYEEGELALEGSINVQTGGVVPVSCHSCCSCLQRIDVPLRSHGVAAGSRCETTR
jgi:hypothetical protein